MGWIIGRHEKDPDGFIALVIFVVVILMVYLVVSEARKAPEDRQKFNTGIEADHD